MIRNKVYEQLKNDYENLKYKYDRAVDDNRLKCDQISANERKIAEMQLAIKQASSTLQDALETIKLQQELMSFMYKGEIAENPSIEFAGVKTLRNGWELLNLRGKDISVEDHDDVTIWANANEAVQVDVENH